MDKGYDAFRMRPPLPSAPCPHFLHCVFSLHEALIGSTAPGASGHDHFVHKAAAQETSARQVGWNRRTMMFGPDRDPLWVGSGFLFIRLTKVGTPTD